MTDIAASVVEETITATMAGGIGPSPYDLWLALGNVGTLADYFDDMVSQLALTVTSASGQSVTTRALLAAIVSPANGQLAYLSELGREGWFKFSTADLSDQVTVDTQKGWYVAPSSDTTGNSGAWVRVERDVINTGHFGSDPTYVSSSVAAFNAATAMAEFLASGSGATTIGVTIEAPDGRYKIDGNLNPISKSGITVKGRSRAGTILECSGTGSVFTWDSAAWGGGLEDMTIRYPGIPADTAAIVTMSDARNQKFERLSVFNYNMLFVGGTAADAPASAIWWSDIDGFAYNSGKSTFDLRWGTSLFLNNVSLYVEGVAVPTVNRTSTMDTLSGTNAINLTNGSWDTIMLSGNCNFNRYHKGLYVNAPGSVITNIWLGDSIIDYCSSDAISLNAPTNATGAVLHVNTGTAYLVSWSGYGIVCTGNNYNANHDFSGTQIYFAGKDGVNLSGSATRNIKMRGMRIGNVNRLAADTYSGIRVGTVQGYIDIHGCTVLADPTGAYSWSAKYGIKVDADVNHFSITDCTAVGTSKNYDIGTNAAASPNRQVCNNRFADYSGFKTGGVYVTPSSLANWVNKSPFTVEVTVAGMDVGLGKTDADGVSKDFAPATSGAWLVKPGEQFFVGYSDIVATKMHFDVLA